jgi:hypothetical protein
MLAHGDSNCRTAVNFAKLLGRDPAALELRSAVVTVACGAGPGLAEANTALSKRTLVKRYKGTCVRSFFRRLQFHAALRAKTYHVTNPLPALIV